MIEVKNVLIGLAAVNARVAEQVLGDLLPLLLLVPFIVGANPGASP